MSFTVQVLGVRELNAGSRRLFQNIEEASREAFAEVAEDVAGQVDVPRLTGELASSVEGRPVDDGAVVQMGESVRYATYVEHGGRGFPHSPQGNYLYPTAIEAGSLLEAAGAQAAAEEIGDMRWPTPT